MYSAADAIHEAVILGKSPPLAAVRAMLDEMFLPPSAPRTAFVPAHAKSAAPVELARRQAPINPPRPVRPDRPVRPPTPNPPRRAPAKRQLTEDDGQRLLKRLQDLRTLLARPATPAPAAPIERPRRAEILTKVERLRDLHTSIVDTEDGVLAKRMHQETTLLDRFAPRNFR